MYVFKLNDGTKVIWDNITVFVLNEVHPDSVNRNSIYKNGKRISMNKLLKDVRSFLDSYFT